jgi:hypothetical protein
MVWSQDWPGILELRTDNQCSSFCGSFWEGLKSWRTHRKRRLFSFSLIRLGSRLSAARRSAPKRCTVIPLFADTASGPRVPMWSPRSETSRSTPAPIPRPEHFVGFFRVAIGTNNFLTARQRVIGTHRRYAGEAPFEHAAFAGILASSVIGFPRRRGLWLTACAVR